MSAVNNVLVVGSGLAGAATAIHLAARGVAVDLVEIKPDVAAIGSGITLQGNALRELKASNSGKLPGAVTIEFAAGTYRLSEPLVRLLGAEQAFGRLGDGSRGLIGAASQA